jgi:hypothetical protein
MARDGLRRYVRSIRTSLDPVLDIEALRSVHRSGIPVEKIRDDGEVTICSVLVGNELDVDSVDSHNITQDDNGILRGLVLGVGDVCSNCTRMNMIACTLQGSGIEASGYGPSPRVLTSPTAVPSCLTPSTQHFPIGYEAIAPAYVFNWMLKKALRRL